ncbi:UTRA domain-containing protein [Streptomyces europaeiscabiei]|uniref:UTRA domain-containing protein n=1 Tax=Streptomyces europaeiscabiei TaxID=146819 RepID=A0AAJ2UK74_9ACTN|nr:UTRA domain-containing protein [Streptomyces europaeiscabiei]MDX3129629.1 UTRA domain-containing protein [Streptomyces europaeiscabiei]
MGSNDAWMGEAQPYLAPRRAGEQDAWSAEAAAHGRRGGQRLLAVEEVDPPAPVRDFFRTEPGEAVVVRRRLILLDDKPVELADSYYPARIARGTRLAEHGKIPGGAVTLLATLGFTPEEDPPEDVHATTATASQCAALDLPPGAPVLVLTRFTTSTTGEPMEVSVMTMTRHLQYRQRKQVV